MELAALTILGIAKKTSLFDIESVGFIREAEMLALTERFEAAVTNVDSEKLT